jgi:hypothetical protein
VKRPRDPEFLSRIIRQSSPSTRRKTRKRKTVCIDPGVRALFKSIGWEKMMRDRWERPELPLIFGRGGRG